MEKALRVLRDEGWVRTLIGDGTYVQEWATLAKEERDVSDTEFYEQIMTKLGNLYDTMERMERRLTELENKHVNEPSPQHDQDERQGQ